MRWWRAGICLVGRRSTVPQRGVLSRRVTALWRWQNPGTTAPQPPQTRPPRRPHRWPTAPRARATPNASLNGTGVCGAVTISTGARSDAKPAPATSAEMPVVMQHRGVASSTTTSRTPVAANRSADTCPAPVTRARNRRKQSRSRRARETSSPRVGLLNTLEMPVAVGQLHLDQRRPTTLPGPRDRLPRGLVHPQPTNITRSACPCRCSANAWLNTGVPRGAD